MLSLNVWIVIRLLETVDSHCGYDFPWAVTRLFPFTISSEYHGYHHLKNIGNYCSILILWDSIFGTNSYYYNEKDNLAKEEKSKQSQSLGSYKKDQ